MKRYLTLFLSVLVSLVMLAQTKMVFHFSTGDSETISVTDIDTIRFNNGVISVEGADCSYNISQIDSATFSVSNPSDTVFVTFDGSNVVVDNPYPNILVEKEGANVTLRSSANVKGVVYYLSGASTDGSFNLVPDRGYTLVLDNLSLASASSAAISLGESEAGESYSASLHLIGESVISDSDQNSMKAAFCSKSKLKVNEDGSTGSMLLKGNKKHALNSSKRVELYEGKFIIEGAVSDGINADGLEVYGGELSISSTQGDGVDCSEVIHVAAGTINVDLASDDAKALKCDSIVEIVGGTIEAKVTGAGSKAIKSGVASFISGGLVSVDLAATEAVYKDTEADYSFNAALTSDGLIEISDQAEVSVTGNGIAAKALNCDSIINILGGKVEIDMNSSDFKATVNGVADTFTACAIKAKKELNIANGYVNVTLGENSNASKGLKADYVTISGGSVRVTDNGGYYYTKNSSSSNNSTNPWGGGGFGGRPGGGGFGGMSSTTTVDGIEPKGIKGDVQVNILGGTTVLFVAHGKGISCDDKVTIGNEGGNFGDLILTINAGSANDETYNKGGENARQKFCCSPKGINCDNEVIINSGTVDIVAYDSGIKGQNVTVNGGKVTISASYDQGMHGVQNFTVNGGDILVSKSYEAFEGVNMTFNGGITSVYSSNDGWNASTSSKGKGTPVVTVNGGYHYLNVNGNDTDVIDSNGSMSFQGGVVVCESNGVTLDCDASPSWNAKAKLMLFGTKAETLPTGSTASSYSSIAASTRYTTVANGSVLASFTTTQTASKLIYVGDVIPMAYVGGLVSNPTEEVEFRGNDGNKMVLTIGGSVENASKSANMNSYSAEPMGGGGFGGW
ncbi:MAG: carbohydrate-binding domain-containing protein [Paludibacteraceae bacterium]|nr:carbohydrate-binding domain-containing protein [Paludibacteraceae bacterium]